MQHARVFEIKMRSKAALKGTRRIRPPTASSHGNGSDQVRFAEADDLSGDELVLVLVHSLTSDESTSAGGDGRYPIPCCLLLPVSDVSTFNFGLRSPASLSAIDHYPPSSASIIPP